MKNNFEECIIQLVPRCNSLNHICTSLGILGTDFYYQRIEEVIKKYGLDTSHFGTLKLKRRDSSKIEDEEFFIKRGKRISGTDIYRRLVNGGYKENKCEICGMTEWQGKSIRMQVHHRNGDGTDNRLENLQLLCPNCHSQTDNFCGKSKGQGKKTITYAINEAQVQKYQPREKRYCKICGKELNGKYQTIYCSYECARKDRQLPITKEDIIHAYNQAHSILGSAKILGVSDNGLRKIAKRLGIFDIFSK